MANKAEKKTLAPVTAMHVESTPDNNGTSAPFGQTEAQTSDAHQAALNEHSMGFVQAVRAYPMAVFWSLMVSMTIIMEGYDTILIGNFYAYPTFQKQYGEFVPSLNKYQISGPWQIGIGNASTIGSIIGSLANGYLIARFGYRPVCLVSLVFMAAFIFMTIFAPTIQILMVGQLLCGIPWGIFATIGSSYASEIVPLALRGYLTAYTNMCFATGQLIGGGVLDSLVSRTDQWGYRIPFALQELWPVPMLIILFFMPESPWWLVRQGRYADAEKSVSRLKSSRATSSEKETIAYMMHTTEIEKRIESGSSYRDCYRGIDLRRTEIACVTFCGQVTSGSQFAYSATYFMEQAGLATADVYKMNLGGTGIAFIGTILAWFIMSRVGRRKIYLAGLAGMAVCLAVIGFLGLAPTSNTSAPWAAGGFAILWLFVFSMSVGPVGWAVPAEVSSTHLRAKTVCLARFSYYMTTIVANVIEPYMINPTEWNWKYKTGFFWMVTSIIWFVWAFFRLPETKDRTFEELDLLFARKVPARKFASTHVDAYEENNDVLVEKH